MNGKYSKTKLVGRRWIIGFGITLFILLALSITFIIYINVTNIVVFEKIKDEGSSVSDNIAAASTPIIVNNIIVGAAYDNKWVSTERYFFKSVNKENTEIDVFTTSGKNGTFKLNEIQRNSEQSTAYTTTTRTNYADEYYAIKPGSSSTNSEILNLNDDSIKKYTEDVKKALGMYSMLNGSIKIKEVQETYITPGKIVHVITATSNSKSGDGVYSCVVFLDDNNKASLVKYNFLKNTKDSEEFNIYSVKFVGDLNTDGKSELILQETKEFETKYTIMEYLNGQFYEVLSSKIKNKK